MSERTRRERAHQSILATYLLAQLPAWILTSIAAWGLWRWAGVPAWAALALVAAWLVKDLLAFPRMKRYYESSPGPRPIAGTCGTAVTPLAPRGYVRVHGELWQAILAAEAESVDEGRRVQVRAIEGLTLVVEAERSR